MMELHEFKTVSVNNEIYKCDNIEDLKNNIIPQLKSQKEQWGKKINGIINENDYYKREFADLCKVSRVTVNKWCNGSIPKNRETFIRIAMAADYTKEQTNQLLKRYGRYPALYPKSLEDCVCIFVLNNYSGKEKLDKYIYILSKIKENFQIPEETRDVTTAKFEEKLSKIQDEDELERFISENIDVFSSAYRKFYTAVRGYIEINYKDLSIFELSNWQKWSSSLKKTVYDISREKWYPTRNKIISLGIHLCMDHEGIDEWLKLVYMEPLCGKNIFESVIMYILDSAEKEGGIYDTGYDEGELIDYAYDVIEELGINEIEDFTSELQYAFDDVI